MGYPHLLRYAASGVRSMDALQNRKIAQEMAAEIMKQKQVPRADRPYIEAVIAEAHLFEEPINLLEVGVNGHQSPTYKITFKGYQKLIPLVKWVNTFLGQNRSNMLQLVCDTYVQTNDKTPLMVVIMDKVEFKAASAGASSSASTSNKAVGKMKKRTE